MTSSPPLVIGSGCHVEVHQCRQRQRGYGTSISYRALFPGKFSDNLQTIVLYRFFYSGIPVLGIPESPGIFRPPQTPNCIPDDRVWGDFSASSAEDIVLLQQSGNLAGNLFLGWSNIGISGGKVFFRDGSSL